MTSHPRWVFQFQPYPLQRVNEQFIQVAEGLMYSPGKRFLLYNFYNLQLFLYL